jgi:amidase
VTRVLRETKAALEAAGHIVIEYTPYDAKAGNDLLLRLLLGDGGGKMHAIVRGGDHPEPWPLQLELFEQVYARYKDRPPTVAGRRTSANC